MKADIFSKIEKATITLIKKGGQGVLIKNQMILTAAHCIEYSFSGSMVLGGYDFYQEIETRTGKFYVSPIAVEPVNDIALLGAPDNQERYIEYEKFDNFCTNTEPILICKNNLEVGKKFKVFIYTHELKWITGYAKLGFPDSPMLWVEANQQVKCGTSGSAIVNEQGEIVGIVSSFSETEKSDGSSPRPLLALPVWICRQILKEGDT